MSMVQMTAWLLPRESRPRVLTWFSALLWPFATTSPALPHAPSSDKEMEPRYLSLALLTRLCHLMENLCTLAKVTAHSSSSGHFYWKKKDPQRWEWLKTLFCQSNNNLKKRKMCTFVTKLQRTQPSCFMSGNTKVRKAEGTCRHVERVRSDTQSLWSTEWPRNDEQLWRGKTNSLKTLLI